MDLCRNNYQKCQMDLVIQLKERIILKITEYDIKIY